jgi:hypothetical protein
MRHQPQLKRNRKLATFGRERPAPGAYYLDFAAVATFPLKKNGQPSTFADIYCKLRDSKIRLTRES